MKNNHRSGQALLEFALVISLCALLLGGTLEFGRTWSAAQVLAGATRDGARAAAVVPASQRMTVATARVQSAAAAYFAPSALAVSVTSGTTAGGEPIVTIGVTGRMTPLFGSTILPAVSNLFTLFRSATMRDELTPGP